MTNNEQLIARDLQHVWHPCSQMKHFAKCPPLVVEKAQGNYLYTNQGQLIDAISSWWCKSLGHGHPAVLQAIKAQMQRFEHVIGANTTHPVLVELAEELSAISGKQHVFFASDGSSAVEIALKLALHAQQVKGKPHKNEFIALKNGYHGETFATMSVSDLALYKEPYAAFNLPCHFIQDIPYLPNRHHSLWKDCDAHWQHVAAQLAPLHDNACAIILEPIVQGANSMRCYSAAFLQRLARWAKEHDVYLIADEIMTGIGRTGKWLACDHAAIQADLICLSKGLTAGTLPLSCVMVDHAVFELFYGDYGIAQSFLHSHTYSANPLAVSAALATLQTMHAECIIEGVQELEQHLHYYFNQVATACGKLTNIRGIGGLIAADLDHESHPTIGEAVYQQGLKYGALLRPLGNTLYWLPPLNTSREVIEKLAEITVKSIKAAYLTPAYA